MIALVIALAAVSAGPRVMLAAVGDVMLDRAVASRLTRFGDAYALKRVCRELEADLVFANLECPLTREPKQSAKRFVFRAAPERVRALVGIDVVSLANNHTLDCGPRGFAETVRTLEAARIVALAPGQPVLIEKNGLRLAFVSVSDFDAGATDAIPGLIRTWRERAEVVIVSVHWGVEGSSKPSVRQRALAQAFAAAGADLILGHGPHVLQPVERVGRTLVAFSMGNFVFDALTPQERDTAIYHYELTKNGASGGPVIPCRIQDGRPAPIARRPRDKGEQNGEERDQARGLPKP